MAAWARIESNRIESSARARILGEKNVDMRGQKWSCMNFTGYMARPWVRYEDGEGEKWGGTGGGVSAGSLGGKCAKWHNGCMYIDFGMPTHTHTHTHTLTAAHLSTSLRTNTHTFAQTHTHTFYFQITDSVHFRKILEPSFRQKGIYISCTPAACANHPRLLVFILDVVFIFSSCPPPSLSLFRRKSREDRDLISLFFFIGLKPSTSQLPKRPTLLPSPLPLHALLKYYKFHQNIVWGPL